MDDSIIEDAKSRLNKKDVEFEDVLTNLEASRITIEKEQLEINQYKAEIEALKQGQIVIPDPDEEVVTITGAVLLPDGTPLLFNDESYILYGNGSISSTGGTGEDNISVTGAILLDDGTPLLLNDGAVLLYENGKVTTESTAGTVEIKGAILLDNNSPLLLNNGDYLLYNNGEIKE